MRKFAKIDILDQTEFAQLMKLLDDEGMAPENGNSYLHKLVKTLEANKAAYGLKATLTIEYNSQFVNDVSAPIVKKGGEESLRSKMQIQPPDGDED